MYFPYFDLAVTKEVEKLRGKIDCVNGGGARSACNQ